MPRPWTRSWRRWAQSFKGGTGPRLLAGTGSDQVHLLIVATADRGLCGAFNSSIVREARRTIRALLAEGKTVKVLAVGRKGRDQLRRDYRQPYRRDHHRPRPAAAVVRRCPEGDGAGHGDVRGRRIRRRLGDLQPLQVGDDPDRHAPAAHSAAGARGRRPRRRPRRAARSTSSSRTRPRSWPTCCRATSPSRSSACCWRMPRASTARR